MKIDRPFDLTFLEYHQDPAWVELLPEHKHPSGVKFLWSGETLDEVIPIAFVSLTLVLDMERGKRTVSPEVTSALKEMRNNVCGIIMNPRSTSVDIEHWVARLNKLWIELSRQGELSTLINQLLDLQRVNLITRYEPENQEDMNWCLQNKNPLSRHAEHIFRQVRLETAKFELWKSNVKDENADQVSATQPPCPWNSVLKNMSLLARELYGHENNPDPLPFDNIMTILEDSGARRREFFEPDSFTSIDNLRTMDVEVAAPILAHDLWAIKRFYPGNDTSRFGLADLEEAICTQLCSLFSHVTISSIGRMCRGWLKESGDLIIHQRKREGWLQGGIPKTIIRGRTLIIFREHPVESSNGFQWEVDCFQVRNKYFTDWEKMSTPMSNPPAYAPPAPVPPAYAPPTSELPAYEPQSSVVPTQHPSSGNSQSSQ